MVKIGDAYYNLALFQRIVFDGDFVELTNMNEGGKRLACTPQEMANVRSWLSHNEWRSPVRDPNMAMPSWLGGKG